MAKDKKLLQPSTSIYLDKSFVTMLLYPMLTSVAVLFVANIAIFPEFGAMGLGNSNFVICGSGKAYGYS